MVKVGNENPLALKRQIIKFILEKKQQVEKRVIVPPTLGG
jgi:hypothetical protein